MQMNMEKKEIVEKISSKCKILDWLERVEMEKWVKKEMKEELKRKRRSYDKVLGFTEKKKKFGDCLEECNLEKNRVLWKEFSVSYDFINLDFIFLKD